MSSLNVKLLNILVYVTSGPAVPFSVIYVTQPDIISCALCFMNFYHPDPGCCLPPKCPRKVASSVLFSSKTLPDFWPGAPQRLGRSLHPSEPHKNLRAKQELFWVTSDPWDVWEWMKPWVLTYMLSFLHHPSLPTSLFLKFGESTTRSVTEALPGTIKAGNEKDDDSGTEQRL